MLKEFTIRNFKSIVDDTISLGKVNVFIGENGCGKTNILEALAMASAAKDDRLNVEGFYSKGIRVAKPTLTFSSFVGRRQKQRIDIECVFFENGKDINVNTSLYCDDVNDIYAKWFDNYKVKEEEHLAEIMKEVFTKKEDVLKKQKHTSTDSILKSIIRSDSEKVQLWDDLQKRNVYPAIKEYVIYNLSIKALRGISLESKKTPLGINGEGLDVLISNFDKEEIKKLKKYTYLISWLKDFMIDEEDYFKFLGLKLGKSISQLYFKDKYMMMKNNIFSAENANDGILHILFYLAFFISEKTPEFFAIDNIETSLNPHLCRYLMSEIVTLAKENDKQVLIATHNPAILDGLNLHDDEQRLFEVFRNDNGYTKTRRIQFKKGVTKKEFKLSEMWMKGMLGAISKSF